jgi:acetate---CoA ligase (ADP-forming)
LLPELLNNWDVIIDYVDKKFKEIDGMVVIFGTPGLFPVFNVYDVLDKKMRECKKPIYPVLPSILTAKEEVDEFLSKGRINFPDEVTLGKALAKVYHTPTPSADILKLPKTDRQSIRKVIDNAKDGYLEPQQVQQLLDAAGIVRAAEGVFTNRSEAAEFACNTGFPVVMKVVGPVHKSDVGGVVLNVKDSEQVKREFDRMIAIKDTTGILIQPMLSGTELFVGTKYEEKFGHLILCGMGGIFIEVLKDVSSALAPVGFDEAMKMITNLKSYHILKGVRGQEGVNIEMFADILVRLSSLLESAPEIYEMDLNPLLGSQKQVIAVDARINISKDREKPE